MPRSGMPRGRRRPAVLSLLVGALALVLSGCAGSLPWDWGAPPPPSPQPPMEPVTPPPPGQLPASRPFRMGVTTWPPGPAEGDLQAMWRFIEEHADLVAYHFDSGVPWPEALALPARPDGYRSLPAGLLADWQAKKASTPPGAALLVSVTPLDSNRAGLAPYRGATENQPLPAPWNTYALDAQPVKQAFLNYARAVVEFFHPDYLAIGIEVNVLLTQSRKAGAPGRWDAYLELNRFVYAELKKAYPDIPVFVTVSLSHINGLDGADRAAQRREVASLMASSDILGLSAYPYGWSYWPTGKLSPVPEDFFDPALRFGKPVGVTETGMPSRDFAALGLRYRFDESEQARYVALLLRKAVEHRFLFVVNWASIDFDRLLDVLPPGQIREIGSIWAYTGLRRANGADKAALAIWDAYLALPYAR